VLDPTTVAHVIGPSQTIDDTPPTRDLSDDLPEPLASVVEYLGADLDEFGREFVPTAELVDALDVEPTVFGRQMGELGCRPRPGRVMTGDGTSRQARGYLVADIRAAIEEALRDESEPGNGQA
jgi:S-DNA-T family DNA segregation ATPase FtsK/SpoIIIE